MNGAKKEDVSELDCGSFFFLFAGKEFVTCTKTQRFFYLFAFFIGDVFLFQCFDITFNVFKMDVQLSLIMCWVHGWECLPCFFFCIFFLNFFGIARRTFLFLVLPTFVLLLWVMVFAGWKLTNSVCQLTIQVVGRTGIKIVSRSK